VTLRRTIELTGIISEHSPNLIETSLPLPRAALERYRETSALQAQNWASVLDELPAKLSGASPDQRSLAWQRTEPVLVDVLAGGLVARVWGAVLTAWARSKRNSWAERIGRDSLVAQLQAHQRLLRLLVDGSCSTLERIVALDRFRRNIERWTDVFVGHLVGRYALADFAFDVERALDFGEEQLRDEQGPRWERVWDLYFLCLRSAFPDRCLPGGIHLECRDNVWLAILGCFPRDHFLEDGMLKSVRLRRLLS